MAIYSYFAHAVMLFCIFLVIKYTFEFYRLKRTILHDDADIKAVLQARDIARIKAVRHPSVMFYRRSQTKETQQSLEEQTLQLFAPLLLKVNALKSIAPALGLCFTVISIILSFQVFASSGDIKMMFQAAAVGLGTTAMGALVMSMAKWLSDRKLIPTFQHIFLLNQAHLNHLRTMLQAMAKRVPTRDSQ
ncbi:MotA/TolQ/ExbB proton channel family protein [Glaciecola sp. 2405UD65-10]|uniref:MotA/TolQ/ExbB proton channel family protein n=1 Tax=Glaciecola sp. 2405UD65-10 TaxID=3397244 RepID=UPI003B5BE22C